MSCFEDKTFFRIIYSNLVAFLSLKKSVFKYTCVYCIYNKHMICIIQGLALHVLKWIRPTKGCGSGSVTLITPRPPTQQCWAACSTKYLGQNKIKDKIHGLSISFSPCVRPSQVEAIGLYTMQCCGSPF